MFHIRRVYQSPGGLWRTERGVVVVPLAGLTPEAAVGAGGGGVIVVVRALAGGQHPAPPVAPTLNAEHFTSVFVSRNTDYDIILRRTHLSRNWDTHAACSDRHQTVFATSSFRLTRKKCETFLN